MPAIKRLLIVLVLLPPVLPVHADQSRLSVQSDPGRAGSFSWEALTLTYSPASGEAVGGWHLAIEGIHDDAVGVLGRLEISCDDGGMTRHGPVCRNGRLDWQMADDGLQLSLPMRLASGESGSRIELIDSQVSVRADWPELSLEIEADGYALDRLPVEWLQAAGLVELQGSVSGRAQFESGALELTFDVGGLAFDSMDGLYAGDGIELQLGGTIDLSNDGTGFEFELTQTAGEILAGSVYLPQPETAVTLLLEGLFVAQGQNEIAVAFQDGAGLNLAGSVVAGKVDDEWQIDAWTIDSLDISLDQAWPRWLDGPLSARGLGGMAADGKIRASARWRTGGFESLSVTAEELELDDPGDRFGISGLSFELDAVSRELVGQVQWSRLGLWGLPFGSGSAGLQGNERRIEITNPVRLPLLDGAVVIEELAWLRGEDSDPEIRLDVAIEPIDLLALTRLMEFPEFGGRLSGRFPGVVMTGELIEFTGDIDVQAFSGQIRISDLAIERPFGTLPALTAQIDIERLDLSELTGTFNFGRMDGQLSGWLHDLRLLDWRPVAMDAVLYTHVDVPRRRISQRAVENLSSLGGAGGAIISGTLLRIFDDFPYRRAGLSCRLSNNICRIDGIAPHDSGGFYIIEGRALPRLDIIGHRRLVDWPQLLAQLAAMMEDQGSAE